MTKFRRILIVTALTLSLTTVSFGGTIVGSRTSSASSRTGTIVGSRAGTIVGSRAGTIVGSRTGTIVGSRTGIVPSSQQSGAAMFHDDLLSRLLVFVLGWSW